MSLPRGVRDISIPQPSNSIQHTLGDYDGGRIEAYRQREFAEGFANADSGRRTVPYSAYVESAEDARMPSHEGTITG